MKNKNTLVRNVLTFLLLLILLAIFIYPIYVILINSFKVRRDIVAEPLSFIGSQGWSARNYTEAFRKMIFPRTFLNSLIITVSSVCLIILTSSLAAYIFARKQWKVNKFFYSLMLASMVIPFQVLMIPLVSVYGAQLNLLNRRITLILMHTGFSVSMAIFMFRSYIATSVPVSLEEAATIDGANIYQTFFRIVLPLLKPITATVATLYSVSIWNDFLLPTLVLTRKGLWTLPIATQQFYGTYSSDLGLIMGALVMVAIPVIVLYLLLQKQVLSGVVAGAVKG
ncbi:carbohydrate ABC transporter permease [Fastidiosipila sanguinis]|uniref:Sugar ABC transporter permease n=1 Tax=Fastidiosipila sanguinis TaxID=236753 RepID=A0A2S0KNJ5_9FIRM|nr:carbohydrate ABC transporter permease [Fastidiosipila sanguinis]AVM42569.1 sugar ABC transporter permease [Fastidiosipila sanguinis]